MVTFENDVKWKKGLISLNLTLNTDDFYFIVCIQYHERKCNIVPMMQAPTVRTLNVSVEQTCRTSNVGQSLRKYRSESE